MTQTHLDKYGFIGSVFSSKSSNAELEVLEFLNSFGMDFEKTRKVIQKELDGYSDKLNMAIEYCGLWCHNENYKPNDYHYSKWKECKEKNIQLLTIFEDEWVFRNKQVKQFLRSKIGSFDRRIYARQTKFLELEPQFKFFDDNHIQGIPHQIKKCYGLTYNDELVACVSYSGHHRKGDQIVLNRLAFKDGTQVVGGASRLIRNSLLLLGIDDVVTWSDNRWSTGEIYKQNGFRFECALPPDYSYDVGR